MTKIGPSESSMQNIYLGVETVLTCFKFVDPDALKHNTIFRYDD